jgi:hypothetical protein
MLSVEVLGAQTPLLIFHCNIIVPELRLVTPDVGKVELLIAPTPESTDQLPTPTIAMLPFNTVVGVPIQIVCEGPAKDTVGRLSTWMVMVELRAGQTPFLIFQLRVLVPKASPPTEVEAEIGETMAPIPPINDQVPVPDKGVLPFSCAVGELMHTV